MDIIAGNYNSAKNRWYENDGSGSFTGHDIQSEADQTTCIFPVDLDGDGDMDILVGNYPVANRWYENDGSGSFTVQSFSADTGNTRSIFAADLDNDGDMDILVGNSGYNRWYENDGSEVFTGDNIHDTDYQNTYSIYPVDLDRDGDMDILAGNSGSKNRWYENDGVDNPDFGDHGHDIHDDTLQTFSIHPADLDGDGDLDIITGSYGSTQKNIWYENNGNQVFSPNDIEDDTHVTFEIYPVDLDLDGDLDIIAGNQGNQNRKYENDGSGSFTASDIHTDSQSTYGVHPVDLDRDGDMDIVAGNYGQVNRWYKNTGGSAGYTVYDTAPANIDDSETAELLRVNVNHNGISTDNDLELNKWYVLFERYGTTTPLDSAEANAIFANLYVYRDFNDNQEFDSGTDTLVVTIDTLSLVSGVQTITFPDGNINAKIAAATSNEDFFIVVQTTSDAGSQTVTDFDITFDPDADSLNDDEAMDTSTSVEDSSPTEGQSQIIPEFNAILLPVSGIIGIFRIIRRKKFHCEK